jgi:hypothetical protein
VNLYLRNKWDRSAHDADVKEFFGLHRKAKWPAAGMPLRIIQGIACWVNPLGQSPGFQRAYAQCPMCGKNMPIGRLAQHAKVHV